MGGRADIALGRFEPRLAIDEPQDEAEDRADEQRGRDWQVESKIASFDDDVTWQSLGLTGDEQVTIEGINAIQPRQQVDVQITRADGSTLVASTTVRIDTDNELDYYRNGGILHYVLRNLANEAA